MLAADIDQVMRIERVIYDHPWTHGNFRDSLHAGYSCWTMECGGETTGYGVLMIGVSTAVLMNVLQDAYQKTKAARGGQV